MQNKFYCQSSKRRKLIFCIILSVGVFILRLEKIEKLGAYPSLLMSEEEIKLISDHLPEREKSEQGFSYLNGNQTKILGVVYVDDHHWSLWASTKLIRSDHVSAIKNPFLKQDILRGRMFRKAPFALPSSIKIIIHSSEEDTQDLG